MKVWLPLCLIAILIMFVMTTAPSKAVAERSLNSYAADNAGLVKITPKPLKMNPSVATLCVSAGRLGNDGIHADKYFDIYISKSGEANMRTGTGTYPLNAVVLKRKYADGDGKTTELYTGMIKRQKGYNPQGGDWEYFVISGDGQKVVQSGTLASCMQCHQSYAASDYVTRGYLTDSWVYHSKIKN